MRGQSKLRAWRKSHGLSLQEVASLTGRSVAGISRIERGERGLKPLRKLEVARALGVPVEDLFDLEHGA